MDTKIIYEDSDLLVVEKTAGIVVFPEGQTVNNTLIDSLLEKYPELKNVGESPRYGVIHRLDKDTSGILLVAKTNEVLIFFQKCFKNREVEKRYITLVIGMVKDDSGIIETLIARSPMDPRKQKAYGKDEKAPESAREAITHYKVLERFDRYTLLEVEIKTGRKHQIRCHMAYIHHPVAGDKIYGFKDSPMPEGLKRQFLHASYLKVKVQDGKIKEFHSDLPEDLNEVLNELQ